MAKRHIVPITIVATVLFAIDPARFIRESSCIFHTRILEEFLHPVG